MTERDALSLYNMARNNYDTNPTYINAARVQEWATALVEISDDYQELLDEADDIIAEPS